MRTTKTSVRQSNPSLAALLARVVFRLQRYHLQMISGALKTTLKNFNRFSLCLSRHPFRPLSDSLSQIHHLRPQHIQLRFHDNSTNPCHSPRRSTCLNGFPKICTCCALRLITFAYTLAPTSPLWSSVGLTNAMIIMSTRQRWVLILSQDDPLAVANDQRHSDRRNGSINTKALCF